MDVSVLAPVLLAAVAHAAWNGWLKKSSPDFVGMAALIGWGLLGEKITRPRWLGVILTVIGLVVARL